MSQQDNSGCMEGFVWSIVLGIIIAIICAIFSPNDKSEPKPDHTYSNNKEARDENLERANKALKNGDEGMAKLWVEEAQKNQDRMDRK